MSGTMNIQLPFNRKMTELLHIEMSFFQLQQHPKYINRNIHTCCDFKFGNPHEFPLTGYVDALQKYSKPQNEQWYGYFSGNEEAKIHVASTLSKRYNNRPYVADDIIMTNGAFGALTVAIQALVETGDEVIYILPPWFFYAGMIHNAGGIPIAVNIRQDNFDLDLDAISAAITPKTKAIIINSPNNPTGKIYQPETLEALGKTLLDASERNGRPIYLISDEAYSRILFDDNHFYSPTAYYPYSLLVYTYGKTILNPGERLGYLAMSPEMVGREALRTPLKMAQAFNALAIPNSLLMHAIEDIEELCIDLKKIQKRRDRLVTALQEIGYKVHIVPEGTFYLLVSSPIVNDWEFFNIIVDENIFVLPGTVVDMPGYFRISLTANDDMVERSISGFATAYTKAIEYHKTKIAD